MTVLFLVINLRKHNFMSSVKTKYMLFVTQKITKIFLFFSSLLDIHLMCASSVVIV
jgi:hypothetical protein